MPADTPPPPLLFVLRSSNSEPRVAKETWVAEAFLTSGGGAGVGPTTTIGISTTLRSLYNSS